MTGSYDLRLVLLSWSVAALASLALLAIARALPGMAASRSRRWVGAGTLAAGTGFWAAHVVGLLAFRLPVETAYGLPVLMASAIPLLLGVGAVLGLAGQGPLAGRRLWQAAAALTAALGATHHAGTAALQIGPYVRHDVLILLSSLATALVLVAGVLAFARPVRTVRAAAAGGAMLGGIVVATQTAGTAAVRFHPDSASLANGLGAATPWAAAVVAVAGITITGLALVVFAFDERMAAARLSGADGIAPVDDADADHVTRSRLVEGIVRWDWDVAADVVVMQGDTASSRATPVVRHTVAAWIERVDPDDRARFRTALDAHVRGETAAISSRHRIDGGEVLVRGRIADDSHDGPIRRVTGWEVKLDAAIGPAPDVASAREPAPGDPVVRVRTDPVRPDVVAAISSNAAGLWGYPAGSLGPGSLITDLIHPDDWSDERMAAWRVRFAAGASRITEDVRVRRSDGAYRWHQLSLAPDGAARGWVGHLMDVDERKHAELHAHAQIRRLAELADGQRDASRDAAVLEDTREMLHLAETMPEAREIIRRACGRLLPGWSGTLTQLDADGRAVVADRWGEHSPVVERFSPRDCWALRSHRVHRYTNPREHALCAHHVPDEAGSPVPHFCLPLVDHRESIGSLHLFAPHACAAGETEELRVRAEGFAKMLGQALSNLRLRLALRDHAMRDALTGLYQRRFLEENLPGELQRAHRDRRAVSVALIDVDHLRLFNERHGRAAGDAVLAAIGRVLAARLRGYDTACRVGGEEVALVLPGCELEDALIRLEEIRCAVEALQLEHGGVSLPVVTVSVGIAEARGGTADALMLRAGQALQRAKQNGRNRIELADREGPVLA